MKFKQFINEAKGSGEYLFSIDDVDKAVETIEKKIDAPFVKVSKSNLGGDERVSILITLSLDEKKDWPNKIKENSRYMNFHLERQGVLEQFTKSHKIEKKFRKAKPKSVEDAIKKINKYLSQVS